VVVTEKNTLFVVSLDVQKYGHSRLICCLHNINCSLACIYAFVAVIQRTLPSGSWSYQGNKGTLGYTQALRSGRKMGKK
jgi:hypothetical protein